MENKRYKIDLDTRAVKMPAGEVIGVYHDKDVNRLTFEVPATYKSIDLTEYQISINYVNEEEQKDVYFIENYTLSDDASIITFDWLVGATACAVPGNVGFTICFKKLDDEAVESEIEERYMTDLAGQLYKELDEVKKHGSDVKGRLAAVITEKGVPTASNESFDDMIANAKKISTGAYGMIINTSLYTKPYGYVCGIYGLLPTETEVS